MPYHVSKQRFGELVAEALQDIPEPFAQYLEEVTVEVRPYPTPRQLKEAGLDPDDLLLGLYHGRARTQRSVEDSAVLPDVIYVFQEDIEEVSENEEDLVREVRITVLHEIGHHFGLDEDDLEELGYR